MHKALSAIDELIRKSICSVIASDVSIISGITPQNSVDRENAPDSR